MIDFQAISRAEEFDLVYNKVSAGHTSLVSPKIWDFGENLIDREADPGACRAPFRPAYI